ncbi:MAG: DsbA family protein, partial [Parvibaculum sp.]
IFGGTKNWHEGNHLRGAAARAGLDMDELDATAEKEKTRLEAVITENEAAQKAAGHWGVPLMAFEGEPFFGQDRVDHLVWRMEQHGLAKRR